MGQKRFKKQHIVMLVTAIAVMIVGISSLTNSFERQASYRERSRPAPKEIPHSGWPEDRAAPNSHWRLGGKGLFACRFRGRLQKIPARIMMRGVLNRHNRYIHCETGTSCILRPSHWPPHVTV